MRLSAIVPLAPILLTTLNISEVKAQECVNYWVNPRTGRTECLDPGGGSVPATPPASTRPAPRPANPPPTTRPTPATPSADELSELRNCTPFRVSYTLPRVPGFMVNDIFSGWENGRCLYTSTVMPQNNSAAEEVFLQCRFTPASLNQFANFVNFLAQSGRFDPTEVATNSNLRSSFEQFGQDCQFYQGSVFQQFLEAASRAYQQR